MRSRGSCWWGCLPLSSLEGVEAPQREHQLHVVHAVEVLRGLVQRAEDHSPQGLGVALQAYPASHLVAVWGGWPPETKCMRSGLTTSPLAQQAVGLCLAVGRPKRTASETRRRGWLRGGRQEANRLLLTPFASSTPGAPSILLTPHQGRCDLTPSTNSVATCFEDRIESRQNRSQGKQIRECRSCHGLRQETMQPA